MMWSTETRVCIIYRINKSAHELTYGDSLNRSSALNFGLNEATAIICVYMRVAMALVRLNISAGLAVPSLISNVVSTKNMKDGKDQKTRQLSTTTDPRYHMEK